MLLLIDSLKEAYFIPIDIQFSSEDMVQLLNNGVYSLHELLLQISQIEKYSTQLKSSKRGVNY